MKTEPFYVENLTRNRKIGEYENSKAGKNDLFGLLLFIDGPYKFSGLPGLIVKVEDEKGDYSFDLKNQKIAELP